MSLNAEQQVFKNKELDATREQLVEMDSSKRRQILETLLYKFIGQSRAKRTAEKNLHELDSRINSLIFQSKELVTTLKDSVEQEENNLMKARAHRENKKKMLEAAVKEQEEGLNALFEIEKRISTMKFEISEKLSLSS